MSDLDKIIYIAIGGKARTGKDTLAKALVKSINNLAPNLKVGIHSLAEPIREELYDQISSYLDINIFKMTDDEKAIVRPFMVGWGETMRKSSGGKYFVEQLENKLVDEDIDVVIVPDLRYKEYDFDELDYFKSKNKHLIIHMSCYKMVNNKRVYNKAPNKQERMNDPKIKNAADVKVDWEYQGEGETLDKLAQFHANLIINDNMTLFI